MKQEHRHGMSGLFVFVLLGLFAVMSTLMVLLGAQMYRHTIDGTEANRKSRILGNYLRSMVRYGDQIDGVAVENLNGIDVISLREGIDDEAYVTRMYVYDGMLYEQFSRERYDFEPEMGEEICAAESMTAELQNGLLSICATNADGEETKVEVYIRCM